MSIVFEKNLTVKQTLFSVVKRFRKHKIKSAELDAEILVMSALKKSREWICANLDYKLSKNKLNRIKKMADRRIQNEPIAYIIKNREFYGLNFFVNKNVLIPRPETELIVDEVMNIISKFVISAIPAVIPAQAEIRNLTRQKLDSRLRGNDKKEDRNNRKKTENFSIIDIGTGSGCIIIALAKTLKTNNIRDLKSPPKADQPWAGEIRFLSSDFSKKALCVARKNAEFHKVDKIIKFYRGNLLNPIIKNAKSKIQNSNLIIIANLPYLTANECKEKSIQREPKEALLGGISGLKYYKELFTQLYEFKTKIKIKKQINLIIEINPHQTKKIRLMIKRIFPKVEIKIIKDLSGQDRIINIQILSS